MTKEVYLVLQGIDFHDGEKVTYEPVFACDTEEYATDSIERLKKRDAKTPYKLVFKIKTVQVYTER